MAKNGKNSRIALIVCCVLVWCVLLYTEISCIAWLYSQEYMAPFILLVVIATPSFVILPYVFIRHRRTIFSP
ncbi:MAG TPA: hypothetical protein VJH75_01665 [Patescibacteria group bacterium]|nr:hypothetical protein [Patescibacteria group bacterium]